jgi:S-adenosylmethionine-diacylgycerolhomoserine-N-methlytransferase
LPEVNVRVSTPAAISGEHAALMESIYRGQRHIYDVTRKYYLFGRDRMIAGLDMPANGSVLEVACGTGRNLALIARRWPGAELFGLDISAEMLKSAAGKLGPVAALAQGDATHFDAAALFGRAKFDRVVLSFATSMIPDWGAALKQAAALVAPGGSLHIVDFGGMGTIPAPLRAILRVWLARFHVTPRANLVQCAAGVAAQHQLTLRTQRGPGGYYMLLVMSCQSASNPAGPALPSAG